MDEKKRENLQFFSGKPHTPKTREQKQLEKEQCSKQMQQTAKRTKKRNERPESDVIHSTHGRHRTEWRLDTRQRQRSLATAIENFLAIATKRRREDSSDADD